MPHPYAKSDTERNFNESVNSSKPKTTFTEFIQPPERGIDFNQVGKKANKLNGNAKAMAKPSMPMIGASKEPVVDTSTNKVPIIGPVQEKDTNTRVNAMSKMLKMTEVVSAF